MSEGDVHQPLIKFLDLPEVVDHLSRGRVLHPCAVQGCLQIRQLRGKSRNIPHGQSDTPLPDLEGKDHQISPPRPGGRPLRKQWGSQKLPLPCVCLSDGARRARVSSHCLPTSRGCRKGSCCQLLIEPEICPAGRETWGGEGVLSLPRRLHSSPEPHSGPSSESEGPGP